MYDLIVEREVGAAVPEDGPLAEFLATGAVEDVKGKARRVSPHAGNVPSAYDFVRHADAGREALPATKRQVIGHQRREGVTPVKLSRAIVAVQFERVRSLVEALLVLPDLVEGMRVGVVEGKIQARGGRLVQTDEPSVVV